jgi:hypothetical protein
MKQESIRRTNAVGVRNLEIDAPLVRFLKEGSPAVHSPHHRFEEFSRCYSLRELQAIAEKMVHLFQVIFQRLEEKIQAIAEKNDLMPFCTGPSDEIHSFGKKMVFEDTVKIFPRKNGDPIFTEIFQDEILESVGKRSVTRLQEKGKGGGEKGLTHLENSLAETGGVSR